MIDLTHAALVVASIYGLVDLAKHVLPENIVENPRWVALMVIVAGQAGVWGLATTVWAHAQVIGGHNLDNLNGGSKVAAGLFFAFGAVVTDKIVGAVKNIGANQVKPVDPRKVK